MIMNEDIERNKVLFYSHQVTARLIIKLKVNNNYRLSISQVQKAVDIQTVNR